MSRRAPRPLASAITDLADRLAPKTPLADVQRVWPAAVGAVIAREAPGIAEAMRAVSTQHTPMGILSRGVAGVAGQTLIVNFPGSPKAIEQLFPVLAPVLGHAAATLSSEGGSRASH